MSKYQTNLCLPLLGMVLLILGICFPANVQAHGEVHALIEALSQRIEANPDSTSLYLQRGILYEGHGDFDHALADYQMVKFKSPDMAVANLRIASLLTDQGHFHSALVFANQYLAASPGNVSGLQVRAMIYSGLQDHAAALQDRIAALESADPRGPEFYLNVARAVLKADSSADSLALGWLDRGLAEAGFLISLADYAVAVEVGAGNYTAALARIEDIIIRIPNNVQWMVARAEVLDLSGQNQLSQQAYGNALRKIEGLSPERRNTESMQNLERTVRNILRINQQR